MRSSQELTACFMSDLKHYNNTNFKTIAKADLSKQDATVHKAFSSVITRFFIFKEKHPEIEEDEFRLLYFVLSLDLIANYFAEYPNTTTEYLVAFQLHLKNYIKERNRNQSHGEDEVEHEGESNTSLPDIGLVADNGVPVEQQQESVSVAV